MLLEGDCALGLPALPLVPRNATESCVQAHPYLSVKFIAKEENDIHPAKELDIYFSDDYGQNFRDDPLVAYYQSDDMRKLKSGDKHPLTVFHEDSQRKLSCHDVRYYSVPNIIAFTSCSLDIHFCILLPFFHIFCKSSLLFQW